jgi:hypothetical protein
VKGAIKMMREVIECPEGMKDEYSEFHFYTIIGMGRQI